nr:hypothetical protein [Anaerolineae bacterium]
MLRNLRTYHRPTDLQEALRLIRQPGTVPLGGGTRLIPSGDASVTAVVDLSRLGLSYIESEMRALCIGATTTLQELVASPDVTDFASGIVREAASLSAARNIRNQATLGGWLASAGPADPLPVVLLALDARLTVWAPEERTVPIGSFLAYRERLLSGDSLITEIALPRAFGAVGYGFERVARTPRDRPIVCAAAFIALHDERCQTARLALGGVADHALRLQQAEQRLAGRTLSEPLIAEVAEIGAQTLDPPGDYLGSSEYRREMAAVLARRALLGAWQGARAVGSG